MNLQEICSSEKRGGWVLWEYSSFILTEKRPTKKKENRETLARAYVAFVEELEKRKGLPFATASRYIRTIWIAEGNETKGRSLPRIIADDGFLRMYALGSPCSQSLLKYVWQRLDDPFEEIDLEPIYPEWNPEELIFFDVNATPPGFLSKFFRYFRLKKDKILISQIAADLEKICQFSDPKRRKLLSLSVLSHSAAYRELQGSTFLVPSFTEVGKLIPYRCHQHLIAEGVKTMSLVPQVTGAPSIYLCQGTELWPSQPSMLGSILANLGEHGSATAAYAHSWRRIHKHLRDLPGLPIVIGHSMGGALAIQIGLYSHNLVQEVYAFNPPVPNDRDFLFYHQLSAPSQEKIQLFVNLDDFAFWRIGSKVIGRVTVFLSRSRWKYNVVTVWNCLLLLPAFIKFIKNVHNAFPAHQRVAALYESWVSFKLTQKEIEKENSERIDRYDYLHFLPKLYDPIKLILTYARRLFGWKLEPEYLRNEIEILALHERDLLDALTEQNQEEVAREIAYLRRQKEILLKQLNKKRN